MAVTNSKRLVEDWFRVRREGREERLICFNLCRFENVRRKGERGSRDCVRSKDETRNVMYVQKGLFRLHPL